MLVLLCLERQHMPAIPEFGRSRQEAFEFAARLGYLEETLSQR